MTRRGGSPRLRPLQIGFAGALGIGAALLVACGGSAKLIPAGNASQLKADFDAVATEVATGSCAAGLQAAVARTQTDLEALPATLDPRLAAALQTGFRTLTSRAGSECKPQKTSTTPTNTTPTNTTPTNTNTNTNTTNTNTQTNTTPTNTNTDTNTTPTDTTPTDTNTTPTDTNTTSTDSTSTVVPGTGGGTPAPNSQGSSTGPTSSGGTLGGTG